MSKVKSGMENEVKSGFLLISTHMPLELHHLLEFGQEISSKYSIT